MIVIILPLLSFLGIAFGGRLLGNKGATLWATSLLGLSFLSSLYLFWQVALAQETQVFVLGTWIQSGLLNVQWSFLFDACTCVMLIVVTSVSFLVHFYSVEYMKEDPHVARFFSYLSLFTFFMLILVTATAFYSYLLVGRALVYAHFC